MKVRELIAILVEENDEAEVFIEHGECFPIGKIETVDGTCADFREGDGYEFVEGFLRGSKEKYVVGPALLLEVD